MTELKKQKIEFIVNTEKEEEKNKEIKPLILKLKVKKEEKHVTWDPNTIDNEFKDTKSSKSKKNN